MNRTARRNKQLVKKYPFLHQKDPFGVKIPDKEYKYDSTMLDNLPSGWVNSFCNGFLEELREALIKNDMLKGYDLITAKKKFARMCWYDNCYIEDVNMVVEKYVEISKHTCTDCGKEAKYIFKEEPICEDCYDKLTQEEKGEAYSIELYYKPL